MNPLARGAARAVFVLCGAGLSAALAAAAPSPTPAPPPCAVVELFTSEGCSSCPPADALLTRIDADARAQGRRVFPLEFHVDYWDGLGWRDPYASAAATDRQRHYAGQLGIEQVYTPQMIVNGKSEFVGSNGARAEREIAAALARPAAVDMSMEAVDAGYRVRLRPSPRGAEVVVARIESGLASQVARGENGGRLLRHSCVVRAFAVATPGPDGAVTVALPGPLAGPHAGRTPAPAHATTTRVIAFAQDRASGAILGATSLTAP